jgi:hypothetical protein
MPRLPHERMESPTRITAGSEEQAQATRGGSVPQYAMPFNVILFLAGFWTAVIYGFATRDLARRAPLADGRLRRLDE